MSALAWIIVILVVLAGIIALVAWFYERATNEVSLVRTGIWRTPGHYRWRHAGDPLFP